MEREIQRAFKKCPFCAETIVIEAVKCRYCGEWIDKRATSRALAKYSDAQPVWQYVLLSIFTFSLYDLHWFYRTWKQLRDQENWDISPSWRLVGTFVPILNLVLIYDLFKHIRDYADAENCDGLFSPGWMLIGWIFFNALVYLPDPYWLISYLSIWPIGVIQNVLNAYWSKKQPTLAIRNNLSSRQIILLILGGIGWTLFIMGYASPEYYTATSF